MDVVGGNLGETETQNEEEEKCGFLTFELSIITYKKCNIFNLQIIH